MIKTVAERQNFNGKNLLMYYFVCATACIGSLVVYLGLNKIFFVDKGYSFDRLPGNRRLWADIIRWLSG